MVGLSPVDEHLMEQLLEAKLNLFALKKNNWIRSERITREEAAVERASTITQIRVVLCLWIGQPGPSNAGQRTSARTQSKPTSTANIGMNPLLSKWRRCLVPGLRTIQCSKLDQVTSLTETAFPPNLRKMPKCATHPETLVTTNGQRKIYLKGGQ